MEHPILFQGSGTYDKFGNTTYTVLMPKITGLSFTFSTNPVKEFVINGIKSIVIHCKNGVDNNQYGTDTENVTITFKFNKSNFSTSNIQVYVVHDADEMSVSSSSRGGKPGYFGTGTIIPVSL